MPVSDTVRQSKICSLSLYSAPIPGILLFFSKKLFFDGKKGREALAWLSFYSAGTRNQTGHSPFILLFMPV
jgi:hypothetical protein